MSFRQTFRRIIGSEGGTKIGPLTRSEFDQLISLAKKVLWADLETREAIQEQKLNVIPANFYSNIPSVAEVRESFEYRQDEQKYGSYFSESIFSLERTEEFLSLIDNYADEFVPPLERPRNQKHTFYWNQDDTLNEFLFHAVLH